MIDQKPLRHKGYGSIAHLPISKMGQGDKRVHFGQAVICLEKFRDKHDELIVQEKLDGSCVAVARINGELTPLVRAGYTANTSPREQHHMFDFWVGQNKERFAFLQEGERVVGEWLAQAHGSRYLLPHEPFVAFDLMVGSERKNFDVFTDRCKELIQPRLIHRGGPFPLHQLVQHIETSGHGAEVVEGAVYRIQRKGEVDFLAKFVRPDFPCGQYLKDVTGHEDLWNWKPEPQPKGKES